LDGIGIEAKIGKEKRMRVIKELRSAPISSTGRWDVSNVLCRVIILRSLIRRVCASGHGLMK
jgi:hypothetical protein